MPDFKISDSQKISIGERTVAENTDDGHTVLFIEHIRSMSYTRLKDYSIFWRGVVLAMVALTAGSYYQQFSNGLYVAAAVMAVTYTIFLMNIRRTLLIETGSGKISISGKVNEQTLNDIEQSIIKKK